MTAARALIAAIAFAQAPAVAQQSHSTALADAQAIYGRSMLALSADGKWIAIVRREDVVVMPVSGGVPSRVPLGDPKSCSAPAWGAHNTLAMTCASLPKPGQRAGERGLYVWRRGDSSLRLAATRVPGEFGWLPDGRRIAYLTTDTARIAEAPPVRTQARARPGSCAPASVIGHSVTPTCSDSVDVVRSRALQSLLDSRAALEEYRRNPKSLEHFAKTSEFDHGDVNDTTSRISAERHLVRVADLDRDTTIVLLPFVGSTPELTVTSDGRRIGIVAWDSSGRWQGRDESWHSAFLVSTGPDIPARRLVARNADLRARLLGSGLSRAGWAWAPDGSAFAWAHGESPDTAHADLINVAAADGTPPATLLLPRLRTESERVDLRANVLTIDESAPTITWTPDATRLVVSAAGNLWLLGRTGGEPRLLSKQVGQIVTAARLASNTEALVATIDPATGRRGIWWVRFEDGRARKAVELAQSGITQFRAATHGNTTTLAYLATTRDAPANVHSLQLSGAGGMRVKQRQLTDAAVVTPLPSVRDTLLSYALTPTVTARSYLVRPTGATGPLPTIVYGYPGDQRAARAAHTPERGGGSGAVVVDVNDAIARGFAFMSVDIPMPPRGRYGERGVAGNITAAVEAAFDAAARTGWVDTTRIGVIGHSFGGYMVNTLVARLPHRFQAAVSMAGISNQVSYVYGGTGFGPEFHAHGQPSMQVHFPSDPLRYLENSPVRYLEQVRTPLLILHGAQDGTVGISQSEELFRGLAQLGKPVEFVRFEKANHPPEADWWPRALTWFETFLKP